MKEIETRDFEHNGRKFVLRLFKTETGFSVVAFHDKNQVSPSYSASLEVHADYFMQHKQSITENLYRIARSDIEVGMYFRT